MYVHSFVMGKVVGKRKRLFQESNKKQTQKNATDVHLQINYSLVKYNNHLFVLFKKVKTKICGYNISYKF